MSYKNYFYFDIETTTKKQTFFDFRLDDERGGNLFLKKYETMKLVDSSWNKPIEDAFIDKAPLIPEYGKIICMSFGMFKDDKKSIMTLVEDDEEALLRRIAKIFNRAGETKRFLCGFNIKIFDIPFLVKKFYKYEIEIPQCLNFIGAKPWEINVTDISDVWKGMGRNGSSLDEVTYELDIPSPKTIMNGNEVYDYYWDKKDTKSIIGHCEQDVDAIIQVTEKLKL